MVHLPRKPEVRDDRRVRIEPLRAHDFKYDAGSLYDGVTRNVWKDFPKLGTTTKGIDREQRVQLSSFVHLVLIPDQPDESYSAVLIGTGIGGRDPVFTAELGLRGVSKVERELKTLGVKFDEIDSVILLSLDFMTASNLIRQDNRGFRDPVCENASFVLHSDEYDIAMTGHEATFGIYQEVRRDMLELEYKSVEFNKWEGDSIDIGNYIHLEHHGAPTPGNSSVSVRLGSEEVVMAPLLFPTPNHIRPEVQLDIGFSRYDTHLAKQRLLEQCYERRSLLLFALDPAQTVGYINKTATNDYQLEPVTGILH